MIGILVGIASLCCASYAQADSKVQDFGQQGQVFAIKERSMLEMIQEKLLIADKNGKLKELQKKFESKVRAKVRHPKAVSFVKHTEIPHEHIYDPSYIQTEDIKDHKGRIVVKAGTTVNPLEHLDWGEPLLFIDGEEESHINWALNQSGKIILVKGAPLDLEETYQRAIYFDQTGMLSKKFGIRHVPAKISQEGKILKVQELRP